MEHLIPLMQNMFNFIIIIINNNNNNKVKHILHYSNKNFSFASCCSPVGGTRTSLS